MCRGHVQGKDAVMCADALLGMVSVSRTKGELELPWVKI